MKRPVRLLLSTLCSGVLLIAAFILAVNLYVQSMGMQSRIREALSDAVGLPVSLFRTTFSPWGGFRLDQIKVGSPQSATGLDLLQAERLEVRCEWLPLLRGEIVLKRIALDSPVFVFQQGAGDAVAVEKKPATQAASTPVPLPAQPATPGAAPTVSPPVMAAKVPRTVPPVMDIRKLLLRDGVFKFLAKDGSEIFRLERVRCSLNAVGKPGEFIGNLEVGRAVIFQSIEIGNLESPVLLQGKKLFVQKMEGTLAGGRVEGSLDANFGEKRLPFNLHLKLAKARLADLFPPDSSWAERLTGLVNGRLELSGSRGKNAGRAEIKITQARASHLPWLQTIAQLSHGGDWENLSIGRAEIRAEIVDSAFQITPSSITSDHLELAVSGTINKRQKLDLQSRLLVDEAVFKKLPTEARENFVEDAGPKTHALDFAVTGTLSAPRSNFLERFIGDRLQKRVQQFLHSFVQGEPTPEPVPLPTVPPTP